MSVSGFTLIKTRRLLVRLRPTNPEYRVVGVVRSIESDEQRVGLAGTVWYLGLFWWVLYVARKTPMPSTPGVLSPTEFSDLVAERDGWHGALPAGWEPVPAGGSDGYWLGRSPPELAAGLFPVFGRCDPEDEWRERSEGSWCGRVRIGAHP